MCVFSFCCEFVHVNVVDVLLLFWLIWSMLNKIWYFLTVGFHLWLYRWASIALSWLLQLFQRWNAISRFIQKYLSIWWSRSLAIYIAICQYVLLYLFSGVSECEIVLMFCRWPPPSPHVHAARVAQEGPCSRYISGSKDWVFF